MQQHHTRAAKVGTSTWRTWDEERDHNNRRLNSEKGGEEQRGETKDDGRGQLGK